MYISHDTDKDCNLLQDRPILLTWRIPHDKTVTIWLQPKSCQVLEGAPCQEWRTDWPTTSCKVTYSDSDPNHFTLKMEAAQTSEMLVLYHNIIWHHNPEDNLKIM